MSVFDTGAPAAVVFETVTITINRNLNSPIFDQQNYETTIYDYYPVGSSVILVNAEDADATSPENLINYDIIDLNNNNNFDLDMFTIHPITGLISTNRALTSEVSNRYTVG